MNPSRPQDTKTWPRSVTKYRVAEARTFARHLWALPTYQVAHQSVVQTMLAWAEDDARGITMQMDDAELIAWNAAGVAIGGGDRFRVERRGEHRALTGPFVDAVVAVLTPVLKGLAQDAGYVPPDIRHLFWTAMGLLSDARTEARLSDVIARSPLPSAYIVHSQDRVLVNLPDRGQVKAEVQAIHDWWEAQVNPSRPQVDVHLGGRAKGVGKDSAIVELERLAERLSRAGDDRQAARAKLLAHVKSQQWYKIALAQIPDTPYDRSFSNHSPRAFKNLYDKAHGRVHATLKKYWPV